MLVFTLCMSEICDRSILELRSLQFSRKINNEIGNRLVLQTNNLIFGHE